MDDAADHYAVLGLDPSADDVVVHAAWRALLRKHHPDTNPADRTGIRAREINQAFAVLGDPGARALYDRNRRSTPRAVTRPAAPPAMRPTRRAARRRHFAPRLFGAALLVAAILPVVGAVLLAEPDTAPAARAVLERFGETGPVAAALVARIEAMVPGSATAPWPAAGADTDPPPARPE